MEEKDNIKIDVNKKTKEITTCIEELYRTIIYDNDKGENWIIVCNTEPYIHPFKRVEDIITRTEKFSLEHLNNTLSYVEAFEIALKHQQDIVNKTISQLKDLIKERNNA